jgi:hypothetical protein
LHTSIYFLNGEDLHPEITGLRSSLFVKINGVCNLERDRHKK